MSSLLSDRMMDFDEYFVLLLPSSNCPLVITGAYADEGLD